MKTITNNNTTTLRFHTGRGGQFYNSGHTVFVDTMKFYDFINLEPNHLFASYTNTSELSKTVENKPNLFELLMDHPEKFEERTGMSIGEPCLNDGNGNTMLIQSEAEQEIGSLNWDGEYNTTKIIYLKDASQRQLELVLKSSGYNKESILQEFFDDCTDLDIDWRKFNDNYEALIHEYFNYQNIDLEDFYTNKN